MHPIWSGTEVVGKLYTLSWLVWKVQADDEAALEDIDAKDGAARGVDMSRHFSYYAFEGKTGVLRWKHEVRSASHISAQPCRERTVRICIVRSRSTALSSAENAFLPEVTC